MMGLDQARSCSGRALRDMLRSARPSAAAPFDLSEVTVLSSLTSKLRKIPERSAALFFIQIVCTLGFAVLYSAIVGIAPVVLIPYLRKLIADKQSPADDMPVAVVPAVSTR